MLIAGGDGKGQDFSPLGPAAAAHARAVVLIGRDRDRIARLAAHHEVNAATVIRMLIKQAAEALPEEPKATPRTAKKKRSHSAE